VAWLLVRKGSYFEAIEWFDRVVAPLARESQLWPAARQALEQLCLNVVKCSTGPAATASYLPPPQPIHPQAPPTSKLPALNVINLGRFQIVRAGTLLPGCRMHKSIALFRYLLTQRNRTVYKEELMELFWPNAQTRAAANSLHVAISILRRYIDPVEDTYLLFDDGHYMINPAAPVEDDCRCFQQHSAEAEQYCRKGDLLRAEQSYTAALAYYHGDYYMNNHDLAWAIAEREQLLTLYLSVLDHLGQIFIIQRRFEPAVECYQHLLERDNYREDAHYQLMQCYWQLGRRSDALRQYKRCAAILAKDLGLEPAQEIQTLYCLISSTNVAS
jgi:DNA-binding SARP family transcriptional activator